MSGDPMKEVIQVGRAAGWRLYRTKRGHWKAYCPCGLHLVTLPGTPSDTRSVKNCVSQLRQTGEWPIPTGGRR